MKLFNPYDTRLNIFLNHNQVIFTLGASCGIKTVMSTTQLSNSWYLKFLVSLGKTAL